MSEHENGAEKPTLRARAKALWARLGGGELSPWRAAASVGIGLAIGVTPLWGTHTILVLAVCVPLKLDARLAYVATNVSLPFFAPFITAAEIEIGLRFLGGSAIGLDAHDIASHARELPGALAIGTLVLSPCAAIAGGIVTYGAAHLARWIRARA